MMFLVLWSLMFWQHWRGGRSKAALMGIVWQNENHSHQRASLESSDNGLNVDESGKCWLLLSKRTHQKKKTQKMTRTCEKVCLCWSEGRWQECVNSSARGASDDGSKHLQNSVVMCNVIFIHGTTYHFRRYVVIALSLCYWQEPFTHGMAHEIKLILSRLVHFSIQPRCVGSHCSTAHFAEERDLTEENSPRAESYRCMFPLPCRKWTVIYNPLLGSIDHTKQWQVRYFHKRLRTLRGK